MFLLLWLKIATLFVCFLMLYKEPQSSMDKRTLFFMAAFAITMFFLNMYFEHQNQDTMKEWKEQQAAKQLSKKRQLENDISERTEVEKELPIAYLYADPEGTQMITGAVQDGKSIMALLTQLPPSQTVYVKTSDSSTLEKYSIAFSPEAQKNLVIYQKEEAPTLAMGYLPELGKYDLQLVSFPNNKAEITLGEYSDGHFSIPLQKLHSLEDDKEKKEVLKTNAIVMIRSDKTYLPVGIYQTDKHAFIHLDEIESLDQLVSKAKPAATTTVSNGQRPEEQFYVLETPYQQLVFSSYGGALAEINLPFQTEKNPQSVVKEIEFDREIATQHPYNAHFPDHAYFKPGKNAQGPYEKVERGTLSGYYPLIRRDLIQTGKRKTITVTPQYYAMNIVSEFPEVAEAVYQVKSFDEKSIVFESVQKHRRITKTFTVDPSDQAAPYVLNLSIKIEGDAKGLWLNSGVPESEWISGASTPTIKYRITRNKKSEVTQVDLPQDSITVSSVVPNWLCISNGFLGLIMDPLTEIDAGYRLQHVSGVKVPSRLVEIGEEYDRFPAESLPGYMGMLPLKSNGGTMQFRIFAGPFAEGILKKVDKMYSDPATGYNPDYIACQSFHGWFAFISEPFAKFLLILMNFFHYLTHSWALSIILLTVALRLMLYPLNAWSMKSMAKMQQIAPEVTALQDKYKKDPKKLQLEIMNLYRERGVNPVSGCFPLLIQMPFLIGMFDLLKSTFELRGASFIPGWIDDLASPDVLFSWSKPIFFIGNQFHLLPFLLGAVMFLQQRMMSTAPKDVNQMTEQQRQQRMMGNIMTIVFTVMFYNFPSGLNIYWLSSMLLGILQQWWTTKQLQKAPKPKVELIAK